MAVESPKAKHLPVVVPFGNELTEEIREAIVGLLGEIFPGSVTEGGEEEIKMTRLTGGLTNVLFKVKLPDSTTVNVRLYGLNSHELIDRDKELATMMRLHGEGLAPPLHATFENGCVYGFVTGSLPCTQELGKGSYDQALAIELARWHRSTSLVTEEEKTAGQAALKVWQDLDGWVERVKVINPPAEEYDLPTALQFYQFIRDKVVNGSHSIGFCHNDLLPGNIVLKPCGDLAFIDVEYAGPNYHLFDLSNHFAERTIDYKGLVVQWEKYPSEEQQRHFFQHYLVHRDQSHPTAAELDQLIADVPLFTALSCLYWSFWSVIQAVASKTAFDYKAFARLRLQLALHFFPDWKPSSSSPSPSPSPSPAPSS